MDRSLTSKYALKPWYLNSAVHQTPSPSALVAAMHLSGIPMRSLMADRSWLAKLPRTAMEAALRGSSVALGRFSFRLAAMRAVRSDWDDAGKSVKYLRCIPA